MLFDGENIFPMAQQSCRVAYQSKAVHHREEQVLLPRSGETRSKNSSESDKAGRKQECKETSVEAKGDPQKLEQ
jgi:hypothetical protein